MDSIPDRKSLTYSNGFYVKCSALFVDIRKSSELPKKHNRPILAKIYRVFISEVIAVMNDNENCAEINVVGDCVGGIFNTPCKEDINSVFSIAGKISALIDIINYKFKKNGITEIKIGIGMSYGRALVIQAGYKGSRINDVVWMGEVVNEASKLAGWGNKGFLENETMVSNAFFSYLTTNRQNLLEKNLLHDCYHGIITNEVMNEWYKNNCKVKNNYW